MESRPFSPFTTVPRHICIIILFQRILGACRPIASGINERANGHTGPMEFHSAAVGEGKPGKHVGNGKRKRSCMRLDVARHVVY